MTARRRRRLATSIGVALGGAVALGMLATITGTVPLVSIGAIVVVLVLIWLVPPLEF